MKVSNAFIICQLDYYNIFFHKLSNHKMQPEMVKRTQKITFIKLMIENVTCICGILKNNDYDLSKTTQ